MGVTNAMTFSRYRQAPITGTRTKATPKRARFRKYRTGD